MDLLSTRVVAGEEKNTGTTEEFYFRIEKRVAYDLSGRNFTDDTGGGEQLGFFLPNATVLFNGTDFPRGEFTVAVSFWIVRFPVVMKYLYNHGQKLLRQAKKVIMFPLLPPIQTYK